MNTRVSLDHQRRMLRHLEAQTAALKTNGAQLKAAIAWPVDHCLGGARDVEGAHGAGAGGSDQREGAT